MNMAAGPEFKPKIIGFLCNWCCYAGADLCGVSRFQYPPYLRVIRLMCSGRVDLAHILRAFSTGQDAVFIGGCHLNDCHYVTGGNYDALGMVSVAKKLLGVLGVNPERLRLEWVSAGEGIRFASIMNEFGSVIEKLGPIASGEGIPESELKFKIKSAKKLIPYIKLVQTEKLTPPERTEESYHRFFSSEAFDRLFDELIADKLIKSQILSLLEKKSLSTGEISEALGLKPSEVSKHMSLSARQGFVRYDIIEKQYVLAR